MSVTMRDVAQRVGVSKQTVSAVLNGKPGISAETIARVRQAIQELGYQPNLVASSLRLGYTNTIGLLVGNVVNPWYAGLARGVEDVAQERGYNIMLCNTYDNPSRLAEYLRAFTRQRITGVIGIAEEHARELVPDTSCIFQNGDPIDDERGTYVATSHLLSLGHRRIACVTSEHSHAGISQKRLQGYLNALADWDVVADEQLIVAGAFDYASGLAAAKQLLQHSYLPTAICAHQDLTAIGVIAGLKRAGLHVPDDIAITGFDGLEIAALYDPSLTTIVQPVYEMGRQAMMRLADKLEQNTTSTPQPLDCTLVVRHSTVPTLENEWLSPPIASEEPWAGVPVPNNAVRSAHA